MSGLRKIDMVGIRFGAQMSDFGFLIPQTCPPAVAWKTKAGHLKPTFKLKPERRDNLPQKIIMRSENEFLKKYQGINLNDGIKFCFLLGFSGPDAVFALDHG